MSFGSGIARGECQSRANDLTAARFDYDVTGLRIGVRVAAAESDFSSASCFSGAAGDVDIATADAA